MSFLFGQKPQLSSEQKLSNAETEVEMISDMYNRCALLLYSCSFSSSATSYSGKLIFRTSGYNNHAQLNAYQEITEKAS